MSEERGSRASRWVIVALVVIGLLVVAGVIGVPWAVRGDLIANQARTCEVAAEFVRERPGAAEGGPEEVGQCLADIARGLDPAVRQRLEDAMVAHDGSLRRPSEPLEGSLLDIPLSAETFAAVERCATARTSRWRGDHGLAERAILERFSREAHLERDPDRRLRRQLMALELWVDVHTTRDLSIVGPLLWSREIGHAGLEADPETRAVAAERMRALAASLPDIDTATALVYCELYGEVRELELFDALEANDQFGASLAMAAETEPTTWGREPAASRLDRAIPTGRQYDQFVEPGSAYVAGTLMLSAHQLDPREETFLGQPITATPLDEAPMSREPCSRLVLPSALDDRELEICATDPAVGVATRELARLYRAVRASALRGQTIPERIDEQRLASARGSRPSESAADSDSALGSRSSALGSRPSDSDSASPCTSEPRPAAMLEAWRAVGYDPPAIRRVALALLHPADVPAPTGPREDPAGWRLLRARWRSACDGPVREAKLWLDGPPDDPRPTPLELGEVSEAGAQSR